MGTESSGMIPSLSWSSDIPGKRHEGRFRAGDGNHGISGAGCAGIVDPTPGPARTSQNSRPVPGSVFQAFLELWKPRECRLFPGKLFRSPTPSGSGISSQNPTSSSPGSAPAVPRGWIAPNPGILPSSRFPCPDSRIPGCFFQGIFSGMNS